jgi:hypothetical protein
MRAKAMRAGTIIVIVGAALCACVNAPPAPVPVEVKDSTTIASARMSWHASTESRVFSPGLEIEYERGLGQVDQRLAANEFIAVDNRTLSGPREVRHSADLRYGQLAFHGIVRVPPSSGFEIDTIAGLGQSHLGLRSESQSVPAGTLAATYLMSGVVLGVGPRWNFSDVFAIEARFQRLASSVSSDDRFWYREIALRYLPVKTVAIRAGYAEMDFRPSKISAGDSPVHVRLYGPFLGLNLMF